MANAAMDTWHWGGTQRNELDKEALATKTALENRRMDEERRQFDLTYGLKTVSNPDEWALKDPTYALGVKTLDQKGRTWQDELRMYEEAKQARLTAQTGIGNVVDTYNRAFAEAQAKNEAKYKQALGLTDQMGGQQAADIRSTYANQRSSALQNLARSGMSGTTVGSTMSQGLAREQTSALNRLSEQLLQSKLGVMQNFKYETPETSPLVAQIQALSNYDLNRPKS